MNFELFRFVVAPLVLMALSFGNSARATLLLEPTSNAGQGYVVAGGGTVGYGFTVGTTTTVAALGLWDVDSNGLVASHQVGLWDSVGTLLASTTITNSSVVVPSTFNQGRWLFENISSFNIGAGQYYLGYLQPATNNGQDLSIHGNVTVNIAGASKGSGTIGGFNNPNALVFPNGVSNSDGFFGPNFSTTAVGVPEPSTIVLAGMGLLGLGFVSRRKKHRRA